MKKLICILSIFFIGYAFSQEENSKWKFKDNVSISGYVKYLPSLHFSNLNTVQTNSLIHNRLNIKAYFGDYLTARVSLRNRIAFGDLVKSDPNYGSAMDSDTNQLDLSSLLIDNSNLVVHSIFDRAYIDYSNGNWQISLGRQRINWGINLAWNSNDLFNAYNIVDFDYEEKAGTDAVRIQYTLKKGSLDFGYDLGENLDDSVIGLLYKFNKWKYDWQIIAANYKTDMSYGMGWAGNIKKAGFNGEITTFWDKNNNDGVLSTSTSLDYFFKKGLYLNASYLYTSNGISDFNENVLQFIGETLSAKKLMPTKYSFLLQGSKEFNPRVKGSLTGIYGAGMDLFFVMPSLDYSIKENWDVNLTAQVFYVNISQETTNLSGSNSIYVRFRYSY